MDEMKPSLRTASVKYLLILILLLSNTLIYPGEKIKRYDKGIIIENDTSRIKIELISPAIVRIVAGPLESVDSPSLIVSEKNIPLSEWSLLENETGFEIETDSLRIKYLGDSGNLEFYKKNELMLIDSGRLFSPRREPEKNDFIVKQTFLISGSEALYGLGQHQNGIMNYKNKSVDLIQDNTEVAVPFLISTKGYGILWDNYSETHFSDNNNVMCFEAECASQVDYYFSCASGFDGIISAYRSLTGSAPLYPKWSYGFFQSRNRYWTQNEVINIAAKFRGRHIPVDAIVLDYLHWGKYGFGSFRFDESFFPDPKRMIDSLHNVYNCRLMVSVWPSFTKNTPNWELMNKNNFLLNVDSYENTQVYDAFNPAAGELYWKLMNASYGQAGIDGWWLDATEPERISEYRKSKNHLGKSEKYLNSYSLVDVRNVYLGQRKSIPEKRVFILTRSAFAGQQSYAASTWSGDIGTTFEVLKKQIPAGLNFCMSGIPYWTTDIGGYKGGDPSDQDYRELYVRWFQYGTFCPIFRSHGRRAPGDRKTPNEIWSYGEQAEKILTKYLNLRYRLLPYIYSEAWQISKNGSTLMRALPFDFKYDENVLNIDDQFMFGKSLLINPVTELNSVSRNLYLPRGSSWFDFWTGETHEGGRTILADAPLDKLPIFVKPGSIVPLGPFLQYAVEKFPDPLELRIYTGANAEFTLYEDANDGYDYEEGKYSEIKFKWDDKNKSLAISDSDDEYSGMKTSRTFNIVLVSKDHGVGVEQENHADRVIEYFGKKTIINFLH